MEKMTTKQAIRWLEKMENHYIMSNFQPAWEGFKALKMAKEALLRNSQEQPKGEQNER